MLSTLRQLTGLTRLEAINLYEDESAAALPHALRGMRRLAMLHLKDNQLSANGTRALAEVLPAFAGSLQHLDLACCRICADAAAGALASALAQATVLAELSLADNALGPQAAEWLPAALAAMPYLRRVNLDNCGLGAAGRTSIALSLGERARCGLHVSVCGNGEMPDYAEWGQLEGMEGVRVLL